MTPRSSTPEEPAEGARRWDGTTLTARQSARRAAKLSERYFYESFDGRDALLRAVLRGAA